MTTIQILLQPSIFPDIPLKQISPFAVVSKHAKTGGGGRHECYLPSWGVLIDQFDGIFHEKCVVSANFSLPGREGGNNGEPNVFAGGARECYECPDV